jgi:dipeptidase E
MKFLLTSAGLRNDVLVHSFAQLTEKPAGERKVAFIPTAAASFHEAWFHEEMRSIESAGGTVTLVDIAKDSFHTWIGHLEDADILVFGGGSEFRLMHYIKLTGLDKVLPELLQTRTYVGISAGSMALCPTIYGHVSREIYEESTAEQQDIEGLGLIDFLFLPHLHSGHFPKVTNDEIMRAKSGVKESIYATDDETALLVQEGVVTTVGTGHSIFIK